MFNVVFNYSPLRILINVTTTEDIVSYILVIFDLGIMLCERVVFCRLFLTEVDMLKQYNFFFL